MGNKERIGLIFLISIIAIGAIVSAVDGDGTGIAYRVAYWIDANTIGNSNITNSGTAVNTQVPLYEQGNRVCTETNGICTANLTFNETDPKVTKTNLKIPRGNGTNQIDGIQTDDGTNINNSGLYNANSYVTDSYNDQGGFSGGYVDTGIQGTFATIGGLQVGWGQNLVAAPEDLSSVAWIASNGNKGGSNLATAPNGLNHAEFWTPTSSTLNNLSTGSSANKTLGMFVFSTFLASNNSNNTSVMLGITNNNGTSCYNTVTVKPNWDRYWVTCNITTPHTIKNGSIHVIGTNVIRIYGSQLQGGTSPTNYLATTSTGWTQRMRYSGNLFTSESNVESYGDLRAGGSDVYDDSGDLLPAGEDSMNIKIDYNNDDADLRNITFTKNTPLGTQYATPANTIAVMLENGKFGVNTTTPSSTFHVVGTTTIDNLLLITPRASAPTGSAGMIYSDTAPALCWYNGTAWHNIDNRSNDGACT